MSKGEAALSLRNFQGGYISDDGYFFGAFPKTEELDRNIAKFNLNNGEAVSGPKIENRIRLSLGIICSPSSWRKTLSTPRKNRATKPQKKNSIRASIDATSSWKCLTHAR